MRSVFFLARGAAQLGLLKPGAFQRASQILQILRFGLFDVIKKYGDAAGGQLAGINRERHRARHFPLRIGSLNHQPGQRVSLPIRAEHIGSQRGCLLSA